METHKIEEYVKVLSEVINNRYNPISPPKMKELFGINKSTQSPNEYDRMKTSLQRILDFYNETKIITIVTDSTLNEINRLKKQFKENVEIPIEERNKLKPFIQLLSEKTMDSSKSTMSDCEKYSIVEKIKTVQSVFVTPKGKKIEESLLPKNFFDLTEDKNGYVETEVNGKKIKLKEKYEDVTYYELVGEKLENINIDLFEEEIETSEGKIKLCIEDVVDMEDKTVSPYHIMYRLFLECDFKDKSGKIKSPIEFEIPQTNTKVFVEFFVSMITTFNYDIQSKSVVELSKSDIFKVKNDETKQFITDTFTKVMIKLCEYHRGDKSYPIQLLLDLIDTKSKLNIKFNIDDEEVYFSNTSIKKLIVRENELDIKLSHSTLTLSNINQISKIQSYDTPLNQSEEDELKMEKEFWKDVEKLKNILTDIDENSSKDMMKTIKEIERISDVFVF